LLMGEISQGEKNLVSRPVLAGLHLFVVTVVPGLS